MYLYTRPCNVAATTPFVCMYNENYKMYYIKHISLKVWNKKNVYSNDGAGNGNTRRRLYECVFDDIDHYLRYSVVH